MDTAPPTAPIAPPPPGTPAWPPRMIAVPMLVSGICNVLTGGGICGSSVLSFFAAPCAIFGIPCLILGIFELITYANGASFDRRAYLDRAKLLGILAICSVLFGNVPSLVCGIVVLTQLPAARTQA